MVKTSRGVVVSWWLMVIQFAFEAVNGGLMVGLMVS